MQAIENAAHRAAGLTQQLLTFARRGPVKPESIAECLSTLRNVLQSGLGSLSTLTIDVDKDVWPVLVDANEFETALVNLVVNARDAMPEGGKVRVLARNLPGQDQVAISVADSGVGIPDDIASKVFDPFFTTKPVGTGLGLSQVHGFAHQAGGTIGLKSVHGQGTTVTICLPKALLLKAAEEVGTINVGTGTILLVEDNPEVAEASTNLIEQLGYTVRWVSDATAALQEIERDSIDIVCCDIVMPGKLDGVALAKAIRATHPTLPILLMTGYAESAREVGSRFPILRKPYQLHELSRETR
jgi:CheY-like chemotaxis protein